MREATIVKVFGLIQEKEKITAKIQKLLGGDNGTIRVSPAEDVERPKVVNGNNSKLAKQRRLQGKYMGALRPLTKTQRKRVSKIREAQGYMAAIKKAKSLQA